MAAPPSSLHGFCSIGSRQGEHAGVAQRGDVLARKGGHVVSLLCALLHLRHQRGNAIDQSSRQRDRAPAHSCEDRIRHRVLFQQLARIGNLPGQFREPHAPARPETGCWPRSSAQAAPKNRLSSMLLSFAPGMPSSAASSTGGMRPGPLCTPGEPDPAAKVDPTIGIDRRFQTHIGELVLPAHPAADRVSHATWRTAMDTS